MATDPDIRWERRLGETEWPAEAYNLLGRKEKRRMTTATERHNKAVDKIRGEVEQTIREEMARDIRQALGLGRGEEIVSLAVQGPDGEIEVRPVQGAARRLELEVVPDETPEQRLLRRLQEFTNQLGHFNK